MLNHIVLMGRLTRDPEMRTTQSGKPVTSFSLAVERDFQKDMTDFVNIVVWNRTAEFVNSYFTKGQLVAVSGSLQIRNWEDQNWNKRQTAEVIAEHVYFAEPKRPSNRPDGGGVPVEASGFTMMDADDDTDLPF